MREHEQQNSDAGAQGRHYPQIETKEFKASIPPHVLARLPDAERFMVEAVSKFETQFDWVVTAIKQTNEDVMDLDVRVSLIERNGGSALENFASEQQKFNDRVEPKLNKLWDWKQVLSGKWAVVAAVAAILIPLLLKYVIETFIALHAAQK